MFTLTLISSSFTAGGFLRSSSVFGQSSGTDEDFTNALESTRTSTTANTESSTTETPASQSNTESPTTQTDDDFTNALESTKTQTSKQIPNVPEGTSQSIESGKDSFGIFKDLKVTEVTDLGYKYRGELIDGGSLNGDLTIIPNVNFTFTRQDIDLAASTGHAFFKISKDFTIADNSIKSESRVFIPYDLLSEDIVIKLRQLGSPQTVSSAIVTAASPTKTKTSLLTSALLQLNNPSLNSITPSIHYIVDSPMAQTSTASPATTDDLSGELFDKMYGLFEDGRAYIEGAEAITHHVLTTEKIHEIINNPLFRSSIAENPAIQFLHEKLEKVNTVLDVVSYSKEAYDIHAAFKEAEDCLNSQNTLQEFEEKPGAKNTHEDLKKNLAQVTDDAYIQLGAYIAVDQLKGLMTTVTKSPILEYTLLHPGYKYVEWVKDEFVKEAADYAKRLADSCKREEPTPKPATEDVGTTDRKPPPLVDALPVNNDNRFIKMHIHGSSDLQQAYPDPDTQPFFVEKEGGWEEHVTSDIDTVFDIAGIEQVHDSQSNRDLIVPKMVKATVNLEASYSQDVGLYAFGDTNDYVHHACSISGGFNDVIKPDDYWGGLMIDPARHEFIFTDDYSLLPNFESDVMGDLAVKNVVGEADLCSFGHPNTGLGCVGALVSASVYAKEKVSLFIENLKRGTATLSNDDEIHGDAPGQRRMKCTVSVTPLSGFGDTSSTGVNENNNAQYEPAKTTDSEKVPDGSSVEEPQEEHKVASGHPIQISITAAGFNPALYAGETPVTWKNDDTVVHTVVAGKIKEPSGEFDSGNIKPLETFTIEKLTGMFPYYCRIHPYMSGSIMVH